jgi:hypothetical protein
MEKETKNDLLKIGPLRFMHFSSRLPPSSTSKAVAAMCSSVLLSLVSKSPVVFGDSWTKVMRSRRGTCGNMQRSVGKHAKKCWGDDVVASADKAANANDVRRTTIKGFLDPQSITAAFERKGKGKVTYSHRQHTKTESRCIRE